MEIDAMRQRVGWICHRKRIKRMGLRLRFRNVFAVAVLVVVAGMASCRRGVVAHPASGAGAAACSLEASATVAHAGDVVRIHVNAVFPRGFSLNYFWTSEAGTLRGKEADMLWRPKDAPPGMHVVMVRVEDGHGAEATCELRMEVASVD